MSALTVNIEPVKASDLRSNVVAYIGPAGAMRDAVREFGPVFVGAARGLRCVAPDTIVVVTVNTGDLVITYPQGRPVYTPKPE